MVGGSWGCGHILMGEVTLQAGVKFDPREVLGRWWGPNVGRIEPSRHARDRVQDFWSGISGVVYFGFRFCRRSGRRHQGLFGLPLEPGGGRYEATVGANRCRANMAHTRQSRTDSGPDFQIKVLKIFQVVLSWLGSGSLTRTSQGQNLPLRNPDSGFRFRVKRKQLERF